MEIFDDFIKYLESQNFSPNTIKAYKRDIKDFLKFLDKIHKKVEDVIPEDIENFVKLILKEGKEDSTIERKLASLKSFFRFAEDKRYIKMNPAELVPFRKRKKRLPDSLTEEEMSEILKVEKERDKTILYVFYGCGLRISELANLKLSDIDSGFEFIRVRGKGGKWRVVPIPSQTKVQLQRYVKERLKNHSTVSEYVFLNRFGGRLSERYIRELVRRYGAIKTGKRVWPHLLRHTYAQHLLKNGLDIRIIQELMGHSSINTTQKYLNAELEHILDVYRRSHPRAK